MHTREYLFRWSMTGAMTFTFFVIQIHGGIETSQYIGCYRDGDQYNRAMSPGSSITDYQLTLEKCRSHCFTTSRFTYFGAEYHIGCFCGNENATRNKLENSSCDTDCNGNSSQKCGGNGALSVYTVCNNGFSGEKCGHRCHCDSLDVCERNEKKCPNNCAAGWKNPSTGCNKDINECLDGTHECQHICINTNGSYRCNCQTGYKLWNRDCIDINECSTVNDCAHNCTNTKGSYFCSCLQGFNLNSDNLSCKDINECDLGTSSCSQNCTNTPGSFECSCLTGYKLIDDQKSCGDINECEERTADCYFKNSICINVLGNYTCKCNVGYETNHTGEYICYDKDECMTGESGCDLNNGSCVNSPGGYECKCNDGFDLLTTWRGNLCLESAHKFSFLLIFIPILTIVVIALLIIILLFIYKRKRIDRASRDIEISVKKASTNVDNYNKGKTVEYTGLNARETIDDSIYQDLEGDDKHKYEKVQFRKPRNNKKI